MHWEWFHDDGIPYLPNCYPFDVLFDQSIKVAEPIPKGTLYVRDTKEM
jgi:hypothetical protein